MSCDEISADWAAQRIKGLDLGVAVMNALKKALLPAKRAPKAGGAGGQDADRKLPVSAQGPGHDVGSGRAQDPEARRQGAEGPRIRAACPTTPPASSGPSRSRAHDGGRETYTAHHVVSLRAGARARREDHADADLAAACARAALPRLPHRRADGEEAGPVPRQLDLHPRSVGEGRPGAELPLVVARDGAAGHELPRARIFLLRGRRPVERARRRADRARQEGDRARSA